MSTIENKPIFPKEPVQYDLFSYLSAQDRLNREAVLITSHRLFGMGTIRLCADVGPGQLLYRTLVYSNGQWRG